MLLAGASSPGMLETRLPLQISRSIAGCPGRMGFCHTIIAIALFAFRQRAFIVPWLTAAPGFELAAHGYYYRPNRRCPSLANRKSSKDDSAALLILCAILLLSIFFMNSIIVFSTMPANTR